MKKSFSLILVMAVLVVFGAITGVVANTSPAYALCSTPKEEGRWANYDPNTRSITRINIRFQCQDVRRNGRRSPSGSPFYLHLYGSCHPTDCDWGENGAERQDDGWILSTIDQGFVTRYVWVKVYPTDSQDWLRVWIWSDFHDPGRADYSSDDWFKRS